MSHAITIGGLLLSIGVLIGLAMTALGVLAIFAGGMSDDPTAGADASKDGCVISGIGAVLLVACISSLIL